jgi:hypothetical protein
MPLRQGHGEVQQLRNDVSTDDAEAQMRRYVRAA